MSGLVLVADGTPETCDALAVSLTLAGYPVLCASSFDDALEQIQHNDFNAIVAVEGSPDLSSIAVLKAARAACPETQVIVSGGPTDFGFALECLRAGAVELLEGPHDIDRALAAVERVTAQRRLRPSRALFEASQVIFSVQDAERLPELIVEVAMRVMAADEASIMIPNAQGVLTIAHSSGLPAELHDRVRVRIGEGVAGRVAADRVAALIPDPRSDRFEHRPGGRVRSSIVFPLVTGGRLVGVLSVNRIVEGVPLFRRPDVDRLAVLASQVVLALENARLLRQTVYSERMAASGQLAAAAAHELNTPTQFIDDNAGFLRDAFGDLMALVGSYRGAIGGAAEAGAIDEATLAALREAEEAADLEFLTEAVPKAAGAVGEGAARVAAIVSSIREFAPDRAAGHAEIDVNQLLRLNLSLAARELERSAEVQTELADLPPLRGVAGELNQAFSNLLRNAAQALELAREVTGRRGRVLVRSAYEGGDVVVSIADTGVGIDPGHRGRVFEPFFTTKGPQASGLGLTVARTAVVERHGGDLSFESEVGGGTTFYVRLPLGGPPELAATAAPAGR